jgi:hypothetical protein
MTTIVFSFVNRTKAKSTTMSTALEITPLAPTTSVAISSVKHSGKGLPLLVQSLGEYAGLRVRT